MITQRIFVRKYTQIITTNHPQMNADKRRCN